MAPTARRVPKGQPGFSARKTKTDHVSLADDSVEEVEETLAGGGKRIAAAFATSSSSEESSPSPPPCKHRQTRATKSASLGDTFDDSTDDGLSPLLPTCHAKANATAAAPIDVDNSDHYFGAEEIGDPFDDPDEDDVQAIAVERLTSSKTPYKKVEKQTVFRNALLVKKSSLLGPNPPQEVDDIYEMWSVSTRSHKTWDIATILLGRCCFLESICINSTRKPISLQEHVLSNPFTRYTGIFIVLQCRRLKQERQGTGRFSPRSQECIYQDKEWQDDPQAHRPYHCSS